MDIIHDHNMEKNLILIKKEPDIFGLLFLGDGATISRIPLLNILVSGKTSSSCIITYLFPGPRRIWWGKGWNLYMYYIS